MWYNNHARALFFERRHIDERKKDEIIVIEFFTKESTNEQMEDIVSDVLIVMEMKSIYTAGV